MTTPRTFLTTSLLLALGVSLPAASLIRGEALPPRTKAVQYEDSERLVKAHLDTCDDLDFNVFTGQNWALLHRSHAQEVLVHWPDGHSTRGIDKHILELSTLFAYAPDTRIKVHTVKFGHGEWTSVIGILEGTFTRPMTAADGRTLAPTGKSFRLAMASISHWNRDGVMDEEHLFWDNQSLLKQIGLGN
jgi:hypothetical protein